MRESLMWLFVVCLPKRFISHLVGYLVHLPLPRFLGRVSVSWFAKKYKINMDEAEKKLTEYPTIGALFTRRLKEGMRPVGEGVVHVADANITQSGWIHEGLLYQAKDMVYTAEELTFDQKAHLTFEGGAYFTYYLCPTDYHRVHCPVDGKIISCRYIPGQLWPVNEMSVRRVYNLFGRNERVVVKIETQWGIASVVLVGATNVGKMSLSYDESGLTERTIAKGEMRKIAYENPIDIRRGDELGIFHMGSTVIVLYDAKVAEGLPEDLTSLRGVVKMGGTLCRK